MNKFFVRKGSEGGITEKLTDIYASLCLEHRPSSESKKPSYFSSEKASQRFNHRSVPRISLTPTT